MMERKRKPRDAAYADLTDVQKAFYDGYDEGYLAGAGPDLLEALKLAAVAFHSLGNPASRTAQAMKRGRQSAREHEGKASDAIKKAGK